MLARGTSRSQAQGSVVERFLRGIDSSKLRDAVLASAVPRVFNGDLLASTIEEWRDEWFDDLKSLPFVSAGDDGWTYHPVVRQEMAEFMRRSTPVAWRQLHERLADWQLGEFGASTGNDDVSRPLPEWSPRAGRLATEWLYHTLCARPNQFEAPSFVESVLAAFELDPTLAQRWVDAAAAATEETEASSRERACPARHAGGRYRR